MPKVGLLGRIHSKAASSTVRDAPHLSKNVYPHGDQRVDKAIEKQSVNTNELDEGYSLSRGQKKRLAKREQFVKREKMILSSLRIQRAYEQKPRIDGLDALKEALNEAISTPKSHAIMDEGAIPVVQVKSNHSKRSIAHKEIHHMSLVRQHPSFVQQPFLTIQEHLRNTFSLKAIELQKKTDEARAVEKQHSLQRKEMRKDRIREAKFDAAKTLAKRKRM